MNITREDVPITKEQMLEIAYKFNPLICSNPTDTMFNTATVLSYLSDLKPIEGIGFNDHFSHGHEMILTMCKNALMFHVNCEDIQ